MLRTLSLYGISGLVLLLCAPVFAHAQVGTGALSSGFQIFPSVCNCPGQAPAWGCVLATLQNVMTFVVALASLLITVFIALAGFSYMTSGGSAEKRQIANKRIMNAVIGLLIVLCAYLLVDSIMKVIYNPNAVGFGPWNSILGSNPGQDCLAIRAMPNALPALFTNNGAGGTGTAGSPTVAATGPGACNASTVQSAAAAEGVQISSADANALACVAKPESNCGAVNQNYKWGQGSSAYGPFQMTLQGNARYFNNPACEKAVGASGPLNCQTGFSGGNPIPGSSVAATCEQAAANLGCSAAAAAALYDQSGIGNWTADSHSTTQGSCGS